MRRVAKVLGGVVAVVAVLYVGFCAVLFLKQRLLIYYPQPNAIHDGITPMEMRVGGETVDVATRPADGQNALLYFGGNADDVSLDMRDFVQTFPGYSIYLLDYPGYGRSSGRPTEKAISADALALYDAVRAGHSHIVVVGRSLGSGVAVRLASERPIARLVLVTPFDSLGDAAAEQYPLVPVRWLLLDKYELWRYAPVVTAPTEIIAAADDHVVPRTSTERLRTRFRPGIASYDLLAGNHHTVVDSPEYPALLTKQ